MQHSLYCLWCENINLKSKVEAALKIFNPNTVEYMMKIEKLKKTISEYKKPE